MAAALPTARPEDVGLSAAALDRLSAALDRARRQRPYAGRGRPGRASRQGRLSRGVRRAAIPPAGAPMPSDAIFRIYSMTKPIVSVGVMMLWEEGRLLLSDPIGKYLPALRQPARSA